MGVAARADAKVLQGFAGLQGPFVSWLAGEVARLADPKPFVVLAAIIVLIALVRRRFRVATAAAGILLGANITTQLLKSVLHDAHPVPVQLAGVLQIRASSWPSGHATAAMSLALCAVLVARAPSRPRVAAAGAAFAVAVCFSFLILVWHYPSDVLGGFLVATCWTLVGVAAVWSADARWPRRTGSSPATQPAPLTARQALGPPVMTVLGAVLLVGIVVLARPHQVVAYVHVHKVFVLGAVGIGALGLALASGLAFATSSRRAPGISDTGRAPRAALPRR